MVTPAGIPVMCSVVFVDLKSACSKALSSLPIQIPVLDLSLSGSITVAVYSVCSLYSLQVGQVQLSPCLFGSSPSLSQVQLKHLHLSHSLSVPCLQALT